MHSYVAKFPAILDTYLSTSQALSIAGTIQMLVKIIRFYPRKYGKINMTEAKVRIKSCRFYQNFYYMLHIIYYMYVCILFKRICMCVQANVATCVHAFHC